MDGDREVASEDIRRENNELLLALAAERDALLAACEEALRYIEDEVEPLRAYSRTAAGGTLRAAIALAKGTERSTS